LELPASEKSLVRASSSCAAPRSRRCRSFSAKSIEMTLRYPHLTPDVRRDTVRLLDRRGDVGETGT
jgi:hypothetical protein